VRRAEATIEEPGAEREEQAATPAPPAPAVAELLGIQQSAGNVAASRAVAGMVARAPLTPAEKAQNLTSPRYAGQSDLEAAYDNAPPISLGAKGSGVAAIQQGLIDAGHEMPISTKSGKPDGIFGKETDATVRAFQGKNGLTPDGDVGRKTMGRLDELAGGGKTSGEPEIRNDEESMGKHVASEMERVNQGDSYGPDKGVWYDYNYFAEHQKDPGTYPWDDDWRQGLASPEYFVRTGWMDWTLKPGKSASAAIQAWLKGLTIAECLTAIIAIEIETMRATLGNTEFDRRYGSEGGPAQVRPLRVHQGIAGSPLEGTLKEVDAKGVYGKRDVKVGDWVYFFNHPLYLIKHPGGAWQGENAVYTGDDAAGQQLFTGLGAAGKTEDGMLAEMAGAYNGERDGYDYVALLDEHASDTPEVKTQDPLYKARDTAYTRSLYEKYLDRIPPKYQEGAYPASCTGQEILDYPETDIGDGTKRKGGFTGTATRLDPAKVKP
jgi:peptidoglycan hydrolase-like protein with peptidoglycan-binding domain